MTNCSTRFCSKKPKTGNMCEECREDKRRAEKFKPVIEKFIESIVAPPGFVKTTGTGYHNGIGGPEDWNKESPAWRKTTWVLVENKESGIAIAININPSPENRYKAGKKVPVRYVLEEISGTGSTCYKEDDGSWRTFDRLGIDSSFYIGGYGSDKIDVVATVEQQLKRIDEAKERSKKMVPIPGFGYSLHQDVLEEVKKKIQKGGSHTFTPSGFGTGHILSAKRGRYCTQLSAETAKFFGVAAIYDQTFDHD